MSPPLLTLLALRVALTANEAPGFSLGWRVPCASAPDAAELVGAAAGAVEVEADPDGSSWRLVVRFLRPVTGERVVRTDSCAEAARAALLIVRLGARGQPAPEPPLLVEVPATAPVPQVAGSAPLRLSLALCALAQHGALPSVVGRLGVTGGLEWAQRWVGLLSVRVGDETVVPGGPSPGSRVVVQPLVGGQASACWQPRAGRVSGGPCALVGAEVWRVRGEQVALPATALGVSVGVGLEARGALRLWEGLSATAALGGRIGLLRPSVFFEDSGVVFQASLLSAEAEVGLRWTW